MPKPKMPEPADEKTKWQRNRAFNLEFYKKKSKDLENETAATMPKSAAPPPTAADWRACRRQFLVDWESATMVQRR